MPTWVRLPRDQWLASWSKMRDLVVPLRLALYGHPDAGTCWEKHCDAKLGEKGFSPVHGWPGCYSHSSLAVFLTVYVDDFKMSGREADVTKAWKLIKEVIQLEEPTPTGRYLGCQHQESMGDLVPHLSPSAELPGITPSKEAKHRVHVLTTCPASWNNVSAHTLS